MAFSQIQYGSKGADVARLQNYLNKYGYNLTVDGDFGTKTQEAVRAYQKNNGLAVDGIVGTNTWSALQSGTNNKPSEVSTPTTPSAPTLGASPTNPTYDTSSYKDSAAGDASWKAYQDALNKVDNYGDFKYGNQAQLDAIMNSILNREKFTYDLNGDALYQQYKDKYTQQAKMAMGDAIGQASAMTGGYGNSYAQSVGQQMYQKEMQNLNDIVPELYQMAYDKYNQEGQDLYNQYGMLTDDYDRGYAKHMDGYNQLMDMLGIKRSDYYDGADLFYTEQNNKNSVADKEFNNAMEILNRNDSNAWAEAEWNRDQTWRDEDIQLQKDRWDVEDKQWQATYDAMYGDKDTGATGGGSGSGGVSYSGSSGSSSGGTSGNPGNGGNNTNNNISAGGVSDSVKEKASSFNNNDDLADYLDGLTKNGVITESQADALYAENRTPDKAPLSKRSWSLVSGGGINWFGGIDNNATVKDQYGNTYRLDKLVDALVAEGMSKSDAKDYVKKLQKQLGA